MFQAFRQLELLRSLNLLDILNPSSFLNLLYRFCSVDQSAAVDNVRAFVVGVKRNRPTGRPSMYHLVRDLNQFLWLLRRDKQCVHTFIFLIMICARRFKCPQRNVKWPRFIWRGLSSRTSLHHGGEINLDWIRSRKKIRDRSGEEFFILTSAEQVVNRALILVFYGKKCVRTDGGCLEFMLEIM
jgi:hypothetical protein